MARHGVAETLTGACVLAVALGFLAYAVAHSGRTGSSGYTLKAQFANISGLAEGADVRIAGVKVGSVTSETLDPKSFEAIVSLTVQNNVQLPTDSAASIVSESLLGGKYISLSPGGNETNLKPDQTITITQSSINLEELLGKFIFSVTSLNGPKNGSSTTNSAAPGPGQSGGTQPDASKPALPPLGQPK